MGIWHRAKWRKENNAGSAIVTVLVVVTFVTILATVMLYISGLNFQMKVTDYRTKESFYQAEIPVEELRAQLVKDVQIAFAKAYTAAMSEYSGLGDEGTREANYRQCFCDELNKIWRERCGLFPGSTNINWKAGIQQVVNSAEGEGYWDVQVEEAPGWDTGRAVSDGQVILSGVTFIYDSPTHYSSVISTDYCITIPHINWSETYDPAPTPAPAPDPESTPAPAPESTWMDFGECVNYMNWTKQ